MSIMLFVLLFVGALLAAEGVFGLLRSGRRRRQAAARRRLRRFAAVVSAPVAAEREESLLRTSDATLVGLERWLRALPFADSLARHLYQAGLPLGVRTFAALSLGIALAGWLAGAWLLDDPRPALVGVILGGLPWLHLQRLRSQRRRRFEEQFPDALDFLIRALRAGHSLSTGFQFASRELPDPVGVEFAQVAHEMRLGQELRTALASLAYRVGSSDLPFFATAIGIQHETGSNLAEVLENLAHVIRERFRLYGKVQALTALGRASASLLALWPFVMVGALFMVNPGYVAPLWETEQGRMIVAVSGGMVVVGYVACRRLATIRV
jgi:tight adherence protein B